MLFRLLADLVGSLLLGLFDSVPTFSFEAPWSRSTIQVPPWFPINVVASTLAGAALINAWAIGATVVDFVWRHIPQVFGTGPGAG